MDLALKVSMIMLGTRDPDKAAAFYTQKLGFTLTSRFEEFAFLDAGGVTLALSGDLLQARPPSGSEPVEIVFASASVKRAYDGLRANGVSFLSEPHVVDGVNYVANFEDLDGHLLSLYGPP